MKNIDDNKRRKMKGSYPYIDITRFVVDQLIHPDSRQFYSAQSIQIAKKIVWCYVRVPYVPYHACLV